MASNYTENYGLCQREATDQVLRTDFNGDNAKLEEALSDLEARVALLDRAVPNLAYYIGQLSLQDLVRRSEYFGNNTMFYEAFLYPARFTLTGGAQISNHVLTLSGSGATGSATTIKMSISNAEWTMARMWLHGDSGDIKVYLNGNEMEWTSTNVTPSVTGENVFEREFTWHGTGSGSVQIRLDLHCDTVSSMSVYDYSIVFF